MRTFRRLWLSVLCALGGSLAYAQEAPTWTLGAGGTSGTVTGGVIKNASPTDFQRLIATNTTTGSSTFQDLVTKVRVGQSDANMTLTRTVTFNGLRTAGAAALRLLPYASLGVFVWDAYNDFRVRPKGDGSLVFDEGQGSTLTPQVCTFRPSFPCAWNLNLAGGKICSGSAAAVGAALVATLPAMCTSSPSNLGMTWTITASTATSFTLRLNRSDGFTGTEVRTTFNENQQLCPAVTDALNPAYSRPAGDPPGPDGKCRTGTYGTVLTNSDAVTKTTGMSPPSRAAGLLAAAMAALPDLRPYVDPAPAAAPGPGVLSGPASVAQPGTVTVGPSGATTTSTPSATVGYSGPGFVITGTTTTTVDPGGTTTTNAPPPTAAITCGLPGTPACKIDEAGTPVLPPVLDPTVGQVADDAARRTAADAQLTDPAFGWFSAPPVVTCTPFEWPGGFSLNPCGPMEIVRSIMAYLWAIFAAWWSFGIVRRTVAGA